MEDAIVADVVLVEKDRSVPELQREYADWNPVDFQDFYLSPGLIDFNVRRCKAWESLEDMTQTAVSGGITLCLQEQSLAEAGISETGARYCDTGLIAVLDNSEVSVSALQEAVAVKGYLTPPDHTTNAVFRLPEWLQRVAVLGLPVILDPSAADPKVLFHASPCRLLPPEERARAPDLHQWHSGTAISSGSDSGESSSSEEKELQSPSTWQLQYREMKRKKFKRPENRVHSVIEERTSPSGDSPSFQITSYFSDISLELRHEPGCMKGRRRPPPLAVDSQPIRQSEGLYIKQLARCPESLEQRGVRMILEALGSLDIKVHIPNLSSAKAIALVQKAKDQRITCETCPHFLFFTDQQIADGDTRFKSFPPIRNKANCNFLWDLVKLNAVDCVCSQHYAVPMEFKYKPDFRKAVSGICGLGFTLQVLWTLLKSPYMDQSSCDHFLVSIAKWTSAHPAKVLGLPQRGSIAKGCLADIVVWDPFEEVLVEQSLAGQPLQCPYLGLKLFGRVQRVYVRGELAFDQGNVRPVGRKVSREDR